MMLRRGLYEAVRHRNARRCARAFTYVEVAIATIVIGLAIPAVLLLIGVTTSQNRQSQEFTTGLMLVNQIREMMSPMSFSAAQALNGRTYNPPVDANRQPISGTDDWQQSVSVQLIGDSQGASLDSVVNNPSAVVELVRVTVSRRSSPNNPWRQVVTTSWMKTKY